MEYDIQCYLQRENHDGTMQSAINTKSRWGGMFVLEAKGLADYGKAKDIVTESYAEGDGLRVYIPSSNIIHREATDVSIKMFFIDDNGFGRYEQYDDLVDYVKSNIVHYWDSVRKRKARLLFVEKSSPEESFKGKLPYIEATIKFKDIDGFVEQLPRWTGAWSQIVCVRVDGLNNGYARRKTYTVSHGTDTPIVFDFMGDFGGTQTPLADNAALADMTESAYLARLNAFCTYVYNYMATTANGGLGFVDFQDDVTNIPQGAYGMSAYCPIQAEWNIEPEQL